MVAVNQDYILELRKGSGKDRQRMVIKMLLKAPENLKILILDRAYITILKLG